ncbi:MAG: Panacea domain-containing protein [Azospirillaceae bacterium]|nr:Panacea domain-containing protein [Azospirillaceae bacterium]
MAMFDDRKAGQVAAFFVNAGGGQLDVLKLVKLIYLADREFMNRCGLPIIFDRLVAMPHGPVNSRTYECIQGAVHCDGWEEWIADRQGHAVTLRKQVSREALDELSNAEIETLQSVWQQFGAMGKWEIRDWTHDHCAEWHDPDGSSRPIPYADVFRALGRDDATAEESAEGIEAFRRIDRLFASL